MREQYWKDGRMIFEVTFPRENWRGHLSANPKLPGWWEAPAPSWEKKGLNHPGLLISLSQASIWSHPPFLPAHPSVNVNHFLMISHLSVLCEETWVLMVQDWVPLYARAACELNWRDACGIKVGGGEDMSVGNRLKSHVWSKYLFY